MGTKIDFYSNKLGSCGGVINRGFNLSCFWLRIVLRNIVSLIVVVVVVFVAVVERGHNCLCHRLHESGALRAKQKQFWAAFGRYLRTSAQAAGYCTLSPLLASVLIEPALRKIELMRIDKIFRKHFPENTTL